tara:strand:+ start:286 stop:858 length:573 start_codon:yes stop_codon:yes gene_type:complete
MPKRGKMTIILNPYVKRQTENSPFSYYAGNIENIPAMVQANFADHKTGYRNGVIEVSLPSEGFYTGVVQLQEGDELTGSFNPRREGEKPRQQILAKNGIKAPAVEVTIILYRSDILAETNDNTLEPNEDNWEIISINAEPIKGGLPIHPMTLILNHIEYSGGTATNMTDTELVNQLRISVPAWIDKVMCG